MRLDAIALVIVAIFALLWLSVAVAGIVAAVPFGVLGLIPLAIILGLLVAVIYQRLHNAEDDYYDKNVDK